MLALVGQKLLVRLWGDYGLYLTNNRKLFVATVPPVFAWCIIKAIHSFTRRNTEGGEKGGVRMVAGRLSRIRPASSDLLFYNARCTQRTHTGVDFFDSLIGLFCFKSRKETAFAAMPNKSAEARRRVIKRDVAIYNYERFTTTIRAKSVFAVNVAA
jgi:hypothetical protein